MMFNLKRASSKTAPAPTSYVNDYDAQPGWIATFTKMDGSTRELRLDCQYNVDELLAAHRPDNIWGEELSIRVERNMTLYEKYLDASRSLSLALRPRYYRGSDIERRQRLSDYRATMMRLYKRWERKGYPLQMSIA